VGGGNWFVQSVWQQIALALALPKIDFGNEHKLLFFLCLGRDSEVRVGIRDGVAECGNIC